MTAFVRLLPFCTLYLESCYMCGKPDTIYFSINFIGSGFGNPQHMKWVSVYGGCQGCSIKMPRFPSSSAMTDPFLVWSDKLMVNYYHISTALPCSTESSSTCWTWSYQLGSNSEVQIFGHSLIACLLLKTGLCHQKRSWKLSETEVALGGILAQLNPIEERVKKVESVLTTVEKGLIFHSEMIEDIQKTRVGLQRNLRTLSTTKQNTNLVE